MKCLILSILTLLASIQTANAFELSTKTLTQYISTTGNALTSSAVQQTNILIPLPASFYVDIWNSLSLDGKSKEIDWTAGWIGSFSNLNINIGASYYDCGKIFTSQDDTISPYFEINRRLPLSEVQALTPSLKVELLALVNGDYPTGTLTHIGIKHTWKANINLDVIQNIKIMYDNGAYGMDYGFLGKYDLNIGVTILDSTVLNLSLAISKPLSGINDRQTEVTPSVGVSTKF